MKTLDNYFVQPGRYFRNFGAKIKSKLYYPLFLKKMGRKALLIDPLKIDNPKGISIGNGSCVNNKAWLNTGGKGKIKIGDNTQIGHYVHIASWYEGVYIGNHVLLADKVFITDCKHAFEDVATPIVLQPVESLGKAVIGDESWIGEGVVINGCTIGKHCIIGANAFVNKDIPDYCVAVGQPARVVKKYDFEQGEWISVR